VTWHETTDVEQWLAAVGDLLLHEPGRHTVVLTLAADPPPTARFGYWHDGSDVTGAALNNEGYPVLLCVVPDEAMRPLGGLWRVERLNGPTALAVQTASVLADGRPVQVLSAQRLFRLGELAMPAVPGAPRLATEQDAELLIGWWGAFLAEAGILGDSSGRVEIPLRTARGCLTVWDDDGGVVAMAGRHDVSFGGARIGPVYTPPEHRGKGYGAAVTAAVSQQALDLGAHEVVLFTDLTNPTSNALYPRLGYVAIEDRAVLQISS
jgi:GNAT superfamily N-acetyltransferase